MQRHELRQLRKDMTFSCPQCKEPVILKVGDVVIPHFSHRKDASCSAVFSEGESKDHIQGKEQLYQFFQRLNKRVQLEPYVDILAQRPDLLVENNALKFPIEFQCSAIPIRKIDARTKGYKSVGMKPIWLLRTPIKLQALPQGVGSFQFSRYEESFITKRTPIGSVFLTYNPQYKQFHYFSSLLQIAGKRYVGLHRILPITNQTFPFAIPKKPTEKEMKRYYYSYLSIRKKFLQARILKNRRGVNDLFLRRCYELRILPIDLPNWIGIPVQDMEAFREHPCEWQLALIYFLKSNGIKLKQFSISRIKYFLSLTKNSSAKQLKACEQYRDFLLRKGMNSVDLRFELSDQKVYEELAITILAKGHEN